MERAQARASREDRARAATCVPSGLTPTAFTSTSLRSSRARASSREPSFPVAAVSSAAKSGVVLEPSLHTAPAFTSSSSSSSSQRTISMLPSWPLPTATSEASSGETSSPSGVFPLAFTSTSRRESSACAFLKQLTFFSPSMHSSPETSWMIASARAVGGVGSAPTAAKEKKNDATMLRTKQRVLRPHSGNRTVDAGRSHNKRRRPLSSISVCDQQAHRRNR